MLFNYLDKAGYRLYAAEDGESALERAKYAQPDLILLDVMMSGLDGFETCLRLQADEATKDIPVIFMTALTETAEKLKGFQAGGVDYITKPLQYAEVLARIETHLKLRQLQKDLHRRNEQLQQEIAQRQQVEAALRQQAHELQAHNEDLNAFSRTVAHDLKSPLNALIGFAEILQLKDQAVFSERQLKYLQNILDSAYQINNITDELLLLARLRETEVVQKPLNMTAIVAQSQLRLMGMITKHQAEIVTPSTWPSAVGYAPWIEQVWVNYLSNAIKYGGRPPHIELGTTPHPNGDICFWIRDNGSGLTAEEQSKIFTEFTRLKQVKVEGYGLGLSIVLRIIKKLGGQVGVESERGQGCRFYFTLKAASPAPPAG
ncbi:MAG: hybrid sensor histidine kinase/response regulator [Anaerolineae bacterium]|nr:hybrid sensor histidine kinase/response regulator [Anaerolineae bacterium]